MNIPLNPKNAYDPSAAARVLAAARTYLENADRLIYSYGSRTFLSGYDLYDRERGDRGNIDCSTFVLLVLGGIDYNRSPYVTGAVRPLTPRPLAELDLSALAQIPERYVGIAERIGRPYLAGPKGLDLDKAAELGISVETLRQEIRSLGTGRRSENLARQLMEREECYSDPAFLRPGDLVFYRSASFSMGRTDPNRQGAVSHVGIVSEDTAVMINSSGYLSKERSLAENLPAVAVAPVHGKRTPAFFARPKYL